MRKGLEVPRDIGLKEVYLHHKNTISFAKKLDKKDISRWLLEVGYYPETYVLPPFFEVNKFHINQYTYFTDEKHKKNKIERVEQIKVEYPTEGLTSRIFALIDPRHYHDLVYICVNNFDKFIKSYKSKRIFSYTFPIPLDTKNPGKINTKRSERQIYEYIEAAEKDLLIDAQDYKYVVVADIKQFYSSIYTHAVAWAIHTKKGVRDNRKDLSYIGNKIDKLLQCSNDGKTNSIAIGPAVSDIISEWMLNAVDVCIDKKLPGRSFGIRFKDDYRIVCDTEDEANQIIKVIESALRKFDLNLSEEKTKIYKLPDGMYRPWIIEYDQFKQSILGDTHDKPISFKAYEMLQRKVFLINKDYVNKGITEKFLGNLISNKCELFVELKNTKEKQLFVAHLTRLVQQKPKVIGQVLGLFEQIIDKDTKSIIEKALRDVKANNNDNEFILCWLLYFKKVHRVKIDIQKPNHEEMPLLRSLYKNKQMFFKDTKDVSLVQNLKNIEMSLTEYTALFMEGK